MSHQCVRYENTQKKSLKKTNSFYFRCVGNQQVYLFWTPPPLFCWVNGRTFFGHALSRSHMAFFDLRVLHFGRVLEETHGAAYLEVVREVLREGQNFNVKVNVIELYVVIS